MNWYDLNFYEIHQIKDEEVKKSYIKKFYLYMTGISGPIIEELKRRGLDFQYSESVNRLPVKEMALQLKQFCNNHGIERDEIHRVVMAAGDKKWKK